MKGQFALRVGVLVACTFPGFGGIIGNWSGSSRSWNSADMATTKATMIGAGHTVLADGPISLAALAGVNVFIIGEALSAPTAGEGTALSSWVNGGGILLVLYDSGCSGCTGNNAVLIDVGSTMSSSGAGATVAPFAGGNFATTGPPFNIVGQSLSTSPGSAIVGGTDLAGNFLAFEQIGSGWVFAFADRSDHNVFSPNDTDANGQLFLNIVGGAAAPGTGVPEPASALLLVSGLAGAYCLRRRRQVR